MSLALVGTLAAAAMAQSPAVSHAPSLGGIDDTNWTLSDILTGGISTPVADGSMSTLDFVDGVAGGSAGCNHFSATYTVDASHLVLGPIMTTRTGCDESTAAPVAAVHSMAPLVVSSA